MTNEKNNTVNEEVEFENSEQVELTNEEVETVFAGEETKEDSIDIDYAAEIQNLTSKLEEADNRYLRLQADFDNFRRRTRLDIEAGEKYRAQKLVTDLLPVLDNFERGLKVEADNEQTKTLLQGMEMVYRSLVEALKKEGVEAIEAVGKEFDPNFHQAVMQGEDEDFGSNIVTDEFQKGYILKDRLIRPSMVKVNQ
ncbi:nucleotide exchange factor GrpE [Neobacillus niacini]|uniref:nucleotide exchange factor GrpE n=1 Tax=Neobacillus niacini TaxID=86668 RepID=UPI0007AB356A|nr:nucleotide exchange factor GrpE [Neobacillus niacini]MEC1522915.1 nucleotide exchange factor GrpE [Neobacillus niacini]